MSDEFEEIPVTDFSAKYYKSGSFVGTLNKQAVLHAINSHDKLVEMNKELLEALETALSETDNNLLLKTYWEETLLKAKELLEEQEI